MSFAKILNLTKPPQPSQQGPYNSILQKLEILRADGRMRFLMSDWNPTDGDPFARVIGQFVGSDVPLRVVDLAGVL